MICGLIIFDKITNDKNYYKKYLLLLKNGCKDWPLDILKKIDIDLTKESTYKKAFNIYESWIDNLNKLISE